MRSSAFVALDEFYVRAFDIVKVLEPHSGAYRRVPAAALEVTAVFLILEDVAVSGKYFVAREAKRFLRESCKVCRCELPRAAVGKDEAVGVERNASAICAAGWLIELVYAKPFYMAAVWTFGGWCYAGFELQSKLYDFILACAKTVIESQRSVRIDGNTVCAIC